MNPIRKIFSLVSILFISLICIFPAQADGVKGNGNVQTGGKRSKHLRNH